MEEKPGTKAARQAERIAKAKARDAARAPVLPAPPPPCPQRPDLFGLQVLDLGMRGQLLGLREVLVADPRGLGRLVQPESRSLEEVMADVEHLDATGTPGPWRRSSIGDIYVIDGLGETSIRALNPDDAELIATFRSAAPRLLQEVRRLQRELSTRKDAARAAPPPGEADGNQGHPPG